MPVWIPTSFGSLDVREHEFAKQGYELLVTPASPGTPAFLLGDGADLWLRLLESPLNDSDLDDQEIGILHSLAADGLASFEADAPARVRKIRPPWMESAIHELVYALLAKVADAVRIEIVFIKGPTLHAQGLRERSHSGDVDCWVMPGDEWRLAEAMKAWGWVPVASAFTGTAVAHSLTLKAESWGCEIDVHTRFPGVSIPPEQAFHLVRSGSEAREFAGVLGLTPAKDMHAIIMALHDLRPVAGVKPSSYAISSVAAMLKAAGPSTVALADSLGAGYVLRTPLTETFPELVVSLQSSEPPREWAWRLNESTTRGLLMALGSLPLRQRPAVLWRLLFPSRGSIVASGRLADTRARLSVAYVRRIWGAMRSLFKNGNR